MTPETFEILDAFSCNLVQLYPEIKQQAASPLNPPMYFIILCDYILFCLFTFFRTFAGINPDSGSKSSLKSGINAKVLTLINQLITYESDWMSRYGIEIRMYVQYIYIDVQQPVAYRGSPAPGGQCLHRRPPPPRISIFPWGKNRQASKQQQQKGLRQEKEKKDPLMHRERGAHRVYATFYFC